jgi:hypothetical protein
MADHLYVSLWLTSVSPLLQPLTLKKLLEAFPFSALAPGLLLRVYAVSFQETPLVEEIFDDPRDVESIAEAAREFYHPDCAIEVEARWDLWQLEAGEWRLAPARVVFGVFGPEFDLDGDEQVRLDLGMETLYLPASGNERRLKPVQSNIQSLVRLVRDLAVVLAVERRSLWTDSGESFAERLLEAVEGEIQ